MIKVDEHGPQEYHKTQWRLMAGEIIKLNGIFQQAIFDGQRIPCTAQVLVGAHGANMANMLFAPDGMKVVEIVPQAGC